MNVLTNKKPLLANILYFLKWTMISGFIGVTVGFLGGLFGKSVIFAARFSNSHTWSVFLMPAAGCIIVTLYRFAHEEKNRGTDMVLESISAKEEIPVITGPLIFASTVLSHLVSASAGREGAALQIGGSMGTLVGRVFRLDERDKKIAIMCGMSACFSALFGTPLAAGLFSMEVVSIGVMYYAALVPCMFSSFIGAAVAGEMGLVPDHFSVEVIPSFGIGGAALAVMTGMLCACVGILFCTMLHKSGHAYRKYVPNPYLRILVGSVIFIGLTLIFKSRYYNGSGMHLIERCFEGEAVPFYAFFMKMVFTAVALGAGFKGGEIVPSLCVGALLGTCISSITGMPVGICSAMGMAALFVSVTNCPVSTIFLAFELFGYEAMPYYVIAVAVSFTLSGYYGLYSSQKFIYSKTRTEYINRKSNG